MKKVLVLAPHTDDGELGCGGTVARLLEEGCEVHFAVFSTCAESVPAGFPADELKTEFLSAMESYGIPAETAYPFRFSGSSFPGAPAGDFGRARAAQPAHRAGSCACPVAARCASGSPYHRRGGHPGLQAHEHPGYEEPWNNLTFNNQVYVTLEERHVEKKIAAVERYISQRGRIYASGEYIRALAMSHGVQIGRQYAEVFETERWIL